MPSRSPPRRYRKLVPLTRRLRLLLPLALVLLLILPSVHLLSSLLRRANSLGRRCINIPYSQPPDSPNPLKIAMVSFSHEEGNSGDPRRSFKGVGEAVGENKRAYAERMGYGFFDARGLVDFERPPSWSKIPAVLSQLGRYDWVFWNDADTLVTNPNVSLENVLYAAIGHSDFNSAPDLVVTEDFNGVNAGVFFVKSSKWSETFLNTWWNQTSFIQFGSTRSGDNFALQYLIDSLSNEDLRVHVQTASMQCLFNSYPWVPSLKSVLRLIFYPATTWKGVYSDGDFMVHLAGLDNKKEWTTTILRELRSVQ